MFIGSTPHKRTLSQFFHVLRNIYRSVFHLFYSFLGGLFFIDNFLRTTNISNNKKRYDVFKNLRIFVELNFSHSSTSQTMNRFSSFLKHCTFFSFYTPPKCHNKCYYFLSRISVGSVIDSLTSAIFSLVSDGICFIFPHHLCHFSLVISVCLFLFSDMVFMQFYLHFYLKASVVIGTIGLDKNNFSYNEI